jgi:hypothetical protein
MSVNFRGNLFTEPLCSNELLRLLGVMSQYNIITKRREAKFIFTLRIVNELFQVSSSS